MQDTGYRIQDILDLGSWIGAKRPILDLGSWIGAKRLILDHGSARSALSWIMDRQHTVLPHLASWILHRRNAPSSVRSVLSNVNNLRSHRILSHDYALYLKWEIPVIDSMSYVYPFKHLFIQDHSYT